MTGEKKNGAERGAAQALDMRFQAQHPLVALAYYVGLFAILFLFDSLVYTAVTLLWLLLLACRAAGVGKTLRLFGCAVGFGCLLLCVNPLVNSEGVHILFYLGEHPVTLESALYGVHNLLLVTALLLVFPSLNRLMDSERILFLFSKLLGSSALILTMSMRFVPLLTGRAKLLLALNRQAGGKAAGRLRHMGRLLGALLDWTMEEGLQTSRTLRARGFGGEARTCYSAFRFTARDACSLCLLLAMMAVLAGLRLQSAGKWLYFPAFVPAAFNALQAAGLCLICLFCGYPFWLEGCSMALRGLETRRKGDLLV